MKDLVADTAKIAALLTLLGLLTGGCTPQTGRSAARYDENWRFVPYILVEDISFGVTEERYRGCTYDRVNEGYWCRVDR